MKFKRRRKNKKQKTEKEKQKTKNNKERKIKEKTKKTTQQRTKNKRKNLAGKFFSKQGVLVRNSEITHPPFHTHKSSQVSRSSQSNSMN